MDKLHKKVIGALRRELGRVTDALDDVEETGRVMGVIISDAFLDLSHRKRQKMVWDILNKALTRDESDHVGPIATLTEAEAAVKA